MIENRASVTPYVLHYGRYLMPECSASGTEWLMGYWDSILLRVIMVAWVVISIFVFMRVQKIKRFLSESEPVEFINPSRGEGSKSSKSRDKESIPVLEQVKGMIPNIEVGRLIKIVVSVTAFWILAVVLFQGSILSYLSRYVEEDHFAGQIQDIVVRYSKDGIASIYLYVDQKPILLRSDRNIDNLATQDKITGGVFEGLESYNLEDPFLEECLSGSAVEVYARRSNAYYSLDGNSRYYIRFVSSMPTCQNIYSGYCIGNNELYEIGERMLVQEEDISCVCTPEGFDCTSGIDKASVPDGTSSCSYFNKAYYPGDNFLTRDECGACECKDDGTIGCTEVNCEMGEYDTTREFELPIYYWFVDEPEPSQTVTVSAGRADSYEVVAYKSFGQMPKTELTMANGKSMLIFSSNQTNIPFVTSEKHSIEGNEAYPEMIRVYSKDMNRYIYVTKPLPAEACQQTLGDGRICVKGDLAGLTVECISEDLDYSACDSVMKTFSVE